MIKNIALFFIITIASFFVSQSAFADGHNHQGVAQILERVSQGLVGRIGVAA